MRLFCTVTSAPLPIARFHESGTPSAPHAASDATAASDPRRIEPFAAPAAVIVEHADFPAGGEQPFDDVLADEPGAAGDQDPLLH